MESNGHKKDYKILTFKINGELREEDIAVLDDIFKKFKEEDITYNINKNNFNLLLNSLDFETFKSCVFNTKSSCVSDHILMLLNDIISGIDSIKSYGLKGKKRIYVGYNKERKVRDRKEKEKNRSQYYYAKENNFTKLNNPLPDTYINKIICGDSLLVLKDIPDNSIDLIFTSPPYNFGLGYKSNEDAHYWENYFNKLFSIFDECIRVLKYGGRIIVNIQPLFSDYIPGHHIISNYFITKKMIWKGEILWEKNNYNCKYTAWGSWKSPSNPYLKYTWEFLEIFCKGSLKKEGKKEHIDITDYEFKKWVIARWSISPARNMKDYNHPAMFPEELAERVLKLFSFQNDIILDPFNGVGTTTFVAKKLNRRYLGIDISEDYCNKALKRLKRFG